MTGASSRTGTGARGNLGGFLLIAFCVLAGCSAASDYQKARALDTPEAYREFLRKHPDDKQHTPRAKRELERLSFEEARAKNTYEGYARHLKAFPRGIYTGLAQEAAEDIRARELGVRLYRKQPADFYEWVDSRRLPYRLLVLSASPDADGRRHLERKWYSEVLRRGLFIPMDPQKTYRVSPDLTLHVRETVVVLCTSPLAFVEADVRVRGKTVQTYRIAASHIEPYLLYEIFKDRDLYDPLFRAPKEAVQAIEQRFEKRRRDLPLKGSLALEFEISQQASDSDQGMIREFVEFLSQLPLCEDFHVYPRGSPPNRVFSQRLYLSVNQETHAPQASREWRSAGVSADWSHWNTKWILEERDYFFRKMTLDLLELLVEPDGSAPLSLRLDS